MTSPEIPDVFLPENYLAARDISDELNRMAAKIVELYGPERGNWIIEQALRAAVTKEAR